MAMAIMLVCMGNVTALAFNDCYLKIANVAVTEDNADYITAPAGSGCEISGVSYDVATHTLTLNNAIIKAHDAGEDDWGSNAIKYYKYGITAPDLTIRLIGKSYIEADYEAIYVSSHVSFVNGNSDPSQRPVLQVMVTDEHTFPFSAICLNSPNDEELDWAGLDIYDCDVDFESPASAIKGFDNYQDGTGRFISVFVNVHGSGTLRAKTRSTRETVGAMDHVGYIKYDGNVDNRNFQMPRNVSYSSDMLNFTRDGLNPYYVKEVRVSPHIDFEDANVENICVANGDENEDGKLDYIEARRVTGFEYEFQDNEEIRSFDELEYFYGIESIGDVFSRCTNLTRIKLPYYLKTIGGWVIRDSQVEQITIPPYVETIENWAFNSCGKLTSVAFVDERRLTSIGEHSFSDCPIKDLQLPSRLNTIGNNAFWGNELTFLDIPSSVTFIGENAFVQTSVPGPSKLMKVKMHSTVPPEIGLHAFGVVGGMGSQSLDPSCRILVPRNPYGVASMSTVYIESSENWYYYRDHIGEWNGYGISVAGVELADDNLGPDGEFSYSSGNTVVSGVFYDPETTTLTLDNAVIKNQNSAYAVVYQGKDGEYNLRVELMGKNVIESEHGGFYSDGSIRFYPKTYNTYDLEAMDLRINAKSCGFYFDNYDFNVFEHTLFFHEGKVSINVSNGPCVYGGEEEDLNGPFYMNLGPLASVRLEKVRMIATSPGHQVLENVASCSLQDCKIIVPVGCTDATTARDELRIGNWIVFSDEEVERICVANWDSNHDGGLDEWEAAAVETLGTVFQGNTFITDFSELRYFTGLTEICDYAFEGCTSLSWASYPPNITRIGNYAFAESNMFCEGVPEGVVEVGNSAFAGCSMEFVGIPSSLKTIGNSAFSGCMGFYYNGGVENSQLETIGARAFYGVMGVDELPASLKSIGDEAFAHDSADEDELYLYLTIYAETPPTIGLHIFGDVQEGSSIVVPEGKAKTYKYKWAEYKDYIVGDDDPIATGIQQAAGDKQRQGIYTLDGRLVRQGSNMDGLPKGIYVVNGKKVMK